MYWTKVPIDNNKSEKVTFAFYKDPNTIYEFI
jgi:hypothetical protein